MHILYIHTYTYVVGNIHKIITEYYTSPRKGSNTMAPYYIHKHRQYIQKESDNDPLKYPKYIQCKYMQSAMNLIDAHHFKSTEVIMGINIALVQRTAMV